MADKKDGLVQRARRVLLLTGTPILNKPIETQPLLAAIAPEEFGNFFAYAKRYCNAHQKPAGRNLVWDFSGATNLPELQERLRSTVMIRRLKKDVLKELPAKRRQVVMLPTNGCANAVRQEQQAYARHEETMRTLQDRVDLAHAAGDPDAYETAAKALQAAASVAFTEIAAARKAIAVAKTPAVIEHVKDVLDGGVDKVIVFAHHHEVVDQLVDAFGTESVSLTGRTAMEDRQAAVDRFQTDPTCKVFIASIMAAGVGLTLTAASTVIFAELDWVPANISQAEDRAHRIGQTQSVLVQHLVVDGSLDSKMVHTLLAKQEIADSALDNSTAIAVPVLPTTEKRPAKYPVASEEERQAAQEGIKFLRKLCDGVRSEDGVGFSAVTAGIGHSLAAVNKPLTDGQVFLARRICRIHRRQLPDAVIEVLGLNSKE